MDGFQVADIETAVSEPDIFTSSTCNFNIINLVRMEVLKNNTLATPEILAQARFIVTIQAKRFHCAKVLFQPKANEPLYRNILTVDAFKGSVTPVNHNSFSYFHHLRCSCASCRR